MAITLNIYIKIKKQYYQLVMLYLFIGTVDANSICKLLAK